MSRKKKSENETNEEAIQRRMFETIANTANRSDKTSWNRKMDNMVKLLSKLRPIQDHIMALKAEEAPLLDEVENLRQVMVNECVHPYEHLVDKGTYVECKFCNRKLSKPDAFKAR